MKILYDHQVFIDQKYGGVSRYFYELLNSFHDDTEIDTSISLAISNNSYIRNCKFIPHHNLLPNLNFRGKARIIKYINDIRSIQNIRKNNFDILHPTYYDPYFINKLNKPFIITVYDMIHEKFKGMFISNNMSSTYYSTVHNKQLVINKAAHIIAISNSTKQDLIDILKIQESKISVVHLGSSLSFSENNVTLATNIPDQFILYVGGRTVYKNFTLFINAYAQVLLNKKDLSLICIGGGKFTPIELALFAKLGIINQVYHYDVEDTTLGSLYSKAILFIFPSLYEGFGIPILEAFACNCPLVCSNTTIFREIAADAAIYFDPYSIDSIYDAIQSVINNGKLRSDLIMKGNLRLKNFTWHKTALATKEVYKTVL